MNNHRAIATKNFGNVVKRMFGEALIAAVNGDTPGRPEEPVQLGRQKPSVRNAPDKEAQMKKGEGEKDKWDKEGFKHAGMICRYDDVSASH